MWSVSVWDFLANISSGFVGSRLLLVLQGFEDLLVFEDCMLLVLQGFEDLLVFEDCMNQYHDNFGKLDVLVKDPSSV